MERKTLRKLRVRITYSCHSAHSRAQLLISAVGMRSFDGKFAKSVKRESASSRSRRESTNVGYLRVFGANVSVLDTTEYRACATKGGRGGILCGH